MSIWSRTVDWLLGPIEPRNALPSDSFTNSALNQFQAYYDGAGPADVHQTAAVEIGLGIIGRSFLAAEITGAALSPLTLAMLARQTIGLGNAVFVIDVSRRTGDIRLLPVAHYLVDGGPNPDSWRYTVRQQRPNGEDPLSIDDLPVRVLPAEGIVHVRYMPSPYSPWQGVAPLSRAGISADTLAKIERSLTYDASVPTGGLLPLPDNVGEAGKTAAFAAISEGKGKTTLVETMAAAWKGDAQGAPQKDWAQVRFGAMVPEASISLRDSTLLSILATLGVPPALYTSAGAALREAFRQLFSDTILPLGALIQHELSEKLERAVIIRFPEVFKTDINARSRSFASWLQNGVDPQYAAKAIGLPLPVEMAPEPEPEPAPEPPAAVPPANAPPVAQNGRSVAHA